MKKNVWKWIFGALMLGAAAAGGKVAYDTYQDKKMLSGDIEVIPGDAVEVSSEEETSSEE